MAVPAAPVRLLLAGACGLLLIGGVAGAVVVDEEDSGSALTGASDPGDTTTTVVTGVGGEVTAPGPVGPGGATTTVAGGRPGTSAAAPGAAATTTTVRAARAGPPGPLVAPKAGSYVYESTSTSPSGPRTGRTTTTVEAAGTEGATTLQAITIPLDLGGQQATARNTVAWGGGATVRRSVITVAALGGQQLDCVWQPAFAQYAGGLAVGKTWSFSTRCAGKIGAIDVTIEQRATRKVTGSAPVAAPAGSVATWTIADDTTVVITSPLGAGTVRPLGTQSLAPSLGVPVRTERRVEARMGGSPPEQSTVTTKLVTLP